ncbi:hypothetical protein VKT23_012643 [Stygiomarasmius scandens]|uniref:C2H2-type domain-containing protein n=1 Tax=Marasmiellus scandens TaxID=2682957 RepID=A0ABR1J8C8_9AGAR
MSSSHTCTGCNKFFTRPSDRTQHHIKTKDPKCQKAAQEEIARLRTSRLAPRRLRPCQTQRASRPRSASPTIEQRRFEGDFFGQDYTEHDFPGFDNGIFQPDGGDTGEDRIDEDNGEDDEDHADTPAPELEEHWEPERSPGIPPDDMDIDSDTPAPPPPNNPLLRHLPAHREGIHAVNFGGQAGAPLPGSTPLYDSTNGFLHYKSMISESDVNPWAPFTSRIDWEVAQWAKMRGSGSTAFTDLLSIEGVREALGLSYCNSIELNKIIDNSIPARRPAFSREEVVIGGKAFDLYKRDILECIRALYGNPDHCQYMSFVPERHYADADHTMRLYHDFHTGRWWWSTQEAIEKDKPGATVIPVIISSDKTQVTLFRNKSAYPVYLTIGNLPKEIRRKPSQQGQILLAYLPTSRLEHLTNKAQRRRAVTNLFHACMSHLVAPLKEAGLEGVVMQSGDGVRRRCHPILAAYVGDYPEQCLVTACYYGDCPCCEAEKDTLGAYPCSHHSRNLEKALTAVHQTIGTDEWVQSCLEANIKPIQHPFWEDLPYTNIFRSITPDILHQLYQGVMKHLISWLTDICGADEIDARVRRLPANHGIRIFHKGISTLSRVSGTEHKQMCAFLLGVITDIPSLTMRQSNKLLTATRALLDFLYLSRYPIQSNESLQALDGSLSLFHDHRDIFIELGAREHFNLPKLHFLSHYSRAIRLYGTTDNYNTETTERLHIDLAKDAYRASNHKDEFSQMTRWLERREKIIHHATYVAWRLAPQEYPESDTEQRIGERFDFPGARRSLTDLKCAFMQKMTRYPTIKSVSLSKLQDTYGAKDFSMALARFIVQFRHPDYTAIQVDEYAKFVVLPFRTLPVWHRVKFVNHELYGKETLDSVSVHPRRMNKQGKVVQASRFDPVLVNVKGSGDYSMEGLESISAVTLMQLIDCADSRYASCPSTSYILFTF